MSRTTSSCWGKELSGSGLVNGPDPSPKTAVWRRPSSFGGARHYRSRREAAPRRRGWHRPGRRKVAEGDLVADRLLPYGPPVKARPAGFAPGPGVGVVVPAGVRRRVGAGGVRRRLGLVRRAGVPLQDVEFTPRRVAVDLVEVDQPQRAPRSRGGALGQLHVEAPLEIGGRHLELREPHPAYGVLGLLRGAGRLAYRRILTDRVDGAMSARGDDEIPVGVHGDARVEVGALSMALAGCVAEVLLEGEPSPVELLPERPAVVGSAVLLSERRGLEGVRGRRRRMRSTRAGPHPGVRTRARQPARP